MFGNRLSNNQDLPWGQGLRMLAFAVKPPHITHLFVALTITFVAEVGQPDALYWFPPTLLTVETSLFLVITLISEIAISIIDRAAAWWQQFAQPQRAMSLSQELHGSRTSTRFG